MDNNGSRVASISPEMKDASFTSHDGFGKPSYNQREVVIENAETATNTLNLAGDARDDAGSVPFGNLRRLGYVDTFRINENEAGGAKQSPTAKTQAERLASLSHIT